jgi:hypothetical protein
MLKWLTAGLETGKRHDFHVIQNEQNTANRKLDVLEAS